MVETICQKCQGDGFVTAGEGLFTCPICHGERFIVPSGASQRHCSTCRTPTDGAPLCDRCARQMRRDCKVTRLAIIARAGVGSGTIRNLQRDEGLVKEYDEWELEQEAKAQQQEDLDEFKTEQMRSLF